MSRRSVFSFRSYLLIKGESRLHKHSMQVTMTHSSYDDMFQHIRHHVDTIMRMPGGLLVFQSFPNGEEITRDSYEYLPYGQICVTIDLRGETHLERGSTTSTTSADQGSTSTTSAGLTASLERLQSKLERLEKVLLKG